MILNFRNRKLEHLFLDGTSKGISPEHLQKITDILDRLDAAQSIQDMRYPGSNLHLLKGKLKLYWSVKVSGNWRIIFKFENGRAFDVDYLDYH